MKYNYQKLTPTARLTCAASEYAIAKYRNMEHKAYGQYKFPLPYTSLTDTEIISARFPDMSPQKVEALRRVITGAYIRPKLKKGFTELVVGLRAAARSSEECHADVDAWHAPSECHGDVARGYQREVEGLMDQYNYTTEELYKQAEIRGVSYKWMYHNIPQTEWEY